MNTAPSSSRIHAGSVFQTILSLMGLGASGLAAILCLLLAYFFARGDAARAGEFVGLAWIFAFLAALTLPSLWFAVRRLMGHVSPRLPIPSFSLASAGLVVWLFVLAIGSFLARAGGIATYILPLLTILGVVLPLWWALELVQRGSSQSGPQRGWGVLNFALFFSNPLAMLVEIVLLIVLVFAGAFMIAADPSNLAQFQQFSQEIRSAGADAERIRQLAAPYLANPLAIAAIFSVFSILVPMLEEIFKSLVIWFLLGKKLSPAEGMVAGALAGAGFALTESLFNLVNPNLQSQWLVLTIGRAGTGMLHITTAALMGWAIASAWQSKSFWCLVLAYIGAVAVHGVWNAFSLGSGLAQVLLPVPSLANVLSIFCVAGLVILAGCFVGFLWAANRRFNAVAPVLIDRTEILQR
jgi:hypothetical protein